MDRKRRLGYAIRRAREKRNLTPPKLAALIGVGADTVNAWERGDSVPSMLFLGPLCEALDADPALFVVLPEEPPSPVDAYLRDIRDVQAATERGLRRGRRKRAAPPDDATSDG